MKGMAQGTTPTGAPARAPVPMAAGEPMTAARLIATVRGWADEGDQAPGDARSLQFTYRGVAMLLVVDENADRMRIVAPIMQSTELGRDELAVLMQANFHTALDARYAITDGVVYSVYIHPLSPLREAQVRSAVEQVASLVATFGSTFSSTDVVFGG